MKYSRRTLLYRSGIAAAALIPLTDNLAAEEKTKPHLQQDDPTAKALKYVEDASKSDSSSRKKDSFCHNCRYFQGTANATWGPCQLFPNNTVHRSGWCSAWVEKPAT